MIISVINNKGGVGKSTITQNLAHALANKGKKVLVIDQDPQSNTTSVLTPPTGANTLYNLYKDNLPIANCIYPTPYDGVDIVPNCNRTDTVEIELYSDVRQSYFLLRDTARDFAVKNYDITLIDCPPNRRTQNTPHSSPIFVRCTAFTGKSRDGAFTQDSTRSFSTLR